MSELERLRRLEAIYEEVIDNLASREREKLQREMAALRAENAALKKKLARLKTNHP